MPKILNTERLKYYTDMYIRYVENGNNRRAVQVGKNICELITKHEPILKSPELFSSLKKEECG